MWKHKHNAHGGWYAHSLRYSIQTIFQIYIDGIVLHVLMDKLCNKLVSSCKHLLHTQDTKLEKTRKSNHAFILINPSASLGLPEKEVPVQVVSNQKDNFFV